MSIEFSVEDIEKFIEFSKAYEQNEKYKSLKKLLSVKEKITIFEGISKEELRGLVYDVRFRRYHKGEYIFKAQDDSEEIYFILQGELHAYSTEQLFIGKVQAGDTFGEMGVVTGEKRNISFKCASQKALLLSFKLDQENLEFNARALAILYRNLAKSVNEKIARLNIAEATERP